MKKMKRLLALMLAGMLALAMFTACGGSVPDDEATARLVREQILPSLNSALKEGGTIVGDDAELQKTAAEVVQTSWKKGEADVKYMYTETSLIVVEWTGTTFVNKDLPSVAKLVDPLIQQVKEMDDKYYSIYNVHAEKADVYTIAHGNEVTFAIVVQYPTIKG